MAYPFVLNRLVDCSNRGFVFVLDLEFDKISRRIHQPKRSECKDEDNGPNILNDKSTLILMYIYIYRKKNV